MNLSAQSFLNDRALRIAHEAYALSFILQAAKVPVEVSLQALEIVSEVQNVHIFHFVRVAACTHKTCFQVYLNHFCRQSAGSALLQYLHLRPQQTQGWVFEGQWAYMCMFGVDWVGC